MQTSSRGNALIWTIIVIAVALLAFYLGSYYSGSMSQSVATSTAATTTTTTVTTEQGSEYYSNPGEWQIYSNTTAGFSIAYPIDFSTTEPNAPKSSTDWRANNFAQAPGIKAFTLTIPAAFDPQTNFGDATLTVGYSMNDVALTNCLVAQNGETTSGTTAIGSANFTVFTSSDAAAGNQYQTTSYRIAHAGYCYAVEYTIHSTQLANYPASYNLHQFDQDQIAAVLKNIVGTFTFL